MVGVFVTRKPWKAALVGLILGPVIGMLYVNRGKGALCYLVASLLVFAAPFIAAHYEILSYDPRKAIYPLLYTLGFIGAFHCYREAKNKNAEPLNWFAHWYGLIIIGILPVSVALLFRGFLFQFYNVASVSMEPTLYTQDYFVVDKRAYSQDHLPQRGDVIVFKVFNGRSRMGYVKRIIGLPGEKVQINDGLVSINNTILKQHAMQEAGNQKTIEVLPENKEIEIIKGKNSIAALSNNTSFYVVPAGQYFVLGDHRDHSHDTSNGLGYVALENIAGKAKAIVWNEKTYKFTYKRIE